MTLQREKGPRIHETVYVADGARLVGDVEIGEGSSVWFNAVVRADIDRIRIGRWTNIQDLAVLHVSTSAPLSIGDRVTVGHSAVLHGCTVSDLCLIGIGAIVLDGAVVGRECMVGAGALVTPKVRIPPRSLVLGSPGRVVRPLTPEELERIEQAAEHYLDLSRQYRRSRIGEK